MKRSRFLRTYPTVLVFKDGSTITMRHQEPRAVIKLPLLLEDAEADGQKLAWLSRRKKMEKVEIKEDVLDVPYDSKGYLKRFKNQRK